MPVRCRPDLVHTMGIVCAIHFCVLSVALTLRRVEIILWGVAKVFYSKIDGGTIHTNKTIKCEYLLLSGCVLLTCALLYFTRRSEMCVSFLVLCARCVAYVCDAIVSSIHRRCRRRLLHLLACASQEIIIL